MKTILHFLSRWKMIIELLVFGNFEVLQYVKRRYPYLTGCLIEHATFILIGFISFCVLLWTGHCARLAAYKRFSCVLQKEAKCFNGWFCIWQGAVKFQVLVHHSFFLTIIHQFYTFKLYKELDSFEQLFPFLFLCSKSYTKIAHL